MKYIYESNNTHFFYIDINVLKYVKINKSYNIIQDFVFLNDKFKDNCTLIIKDFYYKI